MLAPVCFSDQRLGRQSVVRAWAQEPGAGAERAHGWSCASRATVMERPPARALGLLLQETSRSKEQREQRGHGYQ